MSDRTDGPPLTISAWGLTKHYGPILALDHLDLAVPAGSVFGLLGPNGAGKTTTIRILAGLARATSGTAVVAGVEVGIDRPGLRSRLGYLDQEPRFYSWMRGRELLELVGRLHGLDGRELGERVDEMLARVGLTAAASRRIGGYSSGMRQRLGIGQALLHRPGLLILDEPVAALDPEGRRDVLELIAGLRGSTTVVFSSHILADVERICDRVAILDRGRLVAEAPLPELLAGNTWQTYRLVPADGQAAGTARLVERLAAEPWTARVQAQGGEIRVTVTDPASAARGILATVVESRVALETFQRDQPTLEDVFLELVGPPAADDLDARGFVRQRRVGEAMPAVDRTPPVDARRATPLPDGRRARGEGAFAGVGVLLRKELLEQWRTLRLPLTAVVFAFVGFSSPLLARFTPDILRAVGGPIQISLPTPTAADAVAQLLKNLGQFGALTAIVLAMGSVAGEKERGTAALLLAHPASRAAFLAAKLLAIAGTLAVGTVLAAAAAWFYTLVLFEALPIGGFAASAAVQWLQLLAFAAITFLGSTLTRSAVAAAGVAVAALIVLGIASIVPTVAPYLPTGLGTPAAALALGTPADPLVGPVAAVIGLIAVLGGIAWLSFRRQEL